MALALNLSLSIRAVLGGAHGGGNSLFGWTPLKLGSGGLITGIDIAPDGTRVCRTDSFGAYIWSVGLNQWVQILTSDRMPGGTIAIGDGIEEIKIDPSNSSNIWMLWEGNLYKSTNKGVTFAATGYPTQTTFHNSVNSGGIRTHGSFIAIDPNNSSVVYVSTTSNGLWRTIDGGANFTQVAGAPTTWDASAKAANVTLTGSLTTTMASSAIGGVRSVATLPASGLCFMSVAVTTLTAGLILGITNSSALLTQFPGVSDNNGIGINADGQVWINGANPTYPSGSHPSSFVAGDVLDMCVDVTNKVIYWRKNGGNWNNDASANPTLGLSGRGISWSTMTGASGALYAAIAMQNSGDAATANFGASAFTFAKPSGATTLGGSGVSTSAGNGHRLAFDISGSTITVGGQTRTSNIFVNTYGVDTYKSADGGQTWPSTSATNKPVDVTRMVCDPYGVIWVVDDITATTNCCKYDGSTWTVLTLAGGAVGYTSVAIDVLNSPNKANTRICFIEGDKEIVSFSANGGSTWNHAGDTTGRSFASPVGDVQWLYDYYANHVGATFFANCDAAFDPLNSGRLYTGSEGVWYLVPATTGSNIVLNQESRGIEEFISTQIISPSTGSVLMGAWDYPIFRSNSFGTYPAKISGPLGNTQITSDEIGYSMDYQWDNPLNIACIVQDSSGFNASSKEGSGYSNDGGVTWTKFANVPSASFTNSGGTIAITSANVAVWLPGGNQGVPKITNDYTANPIVWTSISIPGGTPTHGWGINAYYTTASRPMDSDKANGDIYIYNWNTTGSGPDAIYKYTRTTGLWSLQSAPGFSNMFFWEQLKTVPGHAGHSFITAGNLQTLPHPQALPFQYTIDGWVSAPKTVTGFLEVTAFGFGATFSGQSYPAIFAAGWYTGTATIAGTPTSVTNLFGVYMCKNFNTSTGAGTWILCGDNLPGKMLIYPNGIDGDKAVQGQVYTFGTGGAFYGRFN